MISDPVPKEHYCSLPVIQNCLINTSSPKPNKSKEVVKGRWTKIQELKYFLFLYHHRKQFSEDQVRRSQRMCKRMSIYLKTRNSIQCRLHHKRTTDKYGGVDQSIASYVEHCPKFYQKYQKVKNFFQVLEDRAFCGDTECYDQPLKPLQSQQKISSNSGIQNMSQKQQTKNSLGSIQPAMAQKSLQITIDQSNFWSNICSYPIYWPVLITQPIIYQI